MTDKELFKQAFEALNNLSHNGRAPHYSATLDALAERFAQPEQEPAAWGFQDTAITGKNQWMMLVEHTPTDDQYGGALWVPLYTKQND